MPFQSSLRFRLLALLTGCLLVVIAIGLACFRYLAHVSALESASVFPKISSSHLKSITSSLDFHHDHSRTC